MRIENLDDIFQKQLIWSYDKSVDDAYFYWDWCPLGTGTETDPKWKIAAWQEHYKNQMRSIDRTFKYDELVGYTNSRNADEMPRKYDARVDLHAKAGQSQDEPGVTLEKDVLRHNIMRSYLEVSEWLGDEEALKYGSHNGFVSRKMSLAWLFNSIKALMNWKLASQDKWAEVDIHPLEVGTWNEEDNKWDYKTDNAGNNICERFLTEGEKSTQGADTTEYSDTADLNQQSGRCAPQVKKRAKFPWLNGLLTVRGNEFHYGERADFYTHNSFMGECRFFHNARFLGQTTFDKEINGTAMRSRWADLAEFKEADGEYLPGTLVMFGGEKEITLSNGRTCHAIVTTNPGLVLNGENQPGKNMVGIALTGTVPVRVIGKVRKFDKLVPSRRYPGMARKRRFYDVFFKKTIGIAMGNSDGNGTVECVTRMVF